MRLSEDELCEVWRVSRIIPGAKRRGIIVPQRRLNTMSYY